MKPIAHTKDGRPIIGPQDGPQRKAFVSPADITFMGGPGGGGKSIWIVLRIAKWVHVKDYRAVIFRRDYNDVVGEGGLWDIAEAIYPALGGVGVKGNTEWMFPSGAKIKLTHLHNELTKFRHQGLAYTGIGFDELPQFSYGQFWYLAGTRNRNYGECKVKPFVLGTGNADADSWCAEFFRWWWNPETGYAIPERDGKIRHFHRDDATDEIIWVDKNWRHPETGDPPKSLAYFNAALETNKLMPNLAQYRSMVNSSDRVTRERIGKGNWLISWSGGLFDPSWFQIVDDIPEGIRLIRYWDLAATEYKSDKERIEKEANPDYTAGVKGGVHDGIFYIVDVIAFRKSPGQSEAIIRDTAEADGHEVDISSEEEKGSSGKWTSEYLRQVLKGYNYFSDPVQGQKEERASKWAAKAEFGRVRLLRGEWNKEFLKQAGSFPRAKRDIIDATSGIYKLAVGPMVVLTYYNPRLHLDNFRKEKKDFDGLNYKAYDVFVSMWMDSFGGVWIGYYLWNYEKMKLKIYNESYIENPTPEILYSEITEKAVVQITEAKNYLSVRKIFCNTEMMKPEKSDISSVLRKVKIRITEATLYDETSSIFRVNKMFAEGDIINHEENQETDRHLRSWGYKNNRPDVGYCMARCLLQVESQLKGTVLKKEFKLLPHYSPKREQVRDKLKTRKLQKKVEKNQYDYLV